MSKEMVMEMSSMRKVFTIMALVLGLAVLSGCSIKTPEIHGTVLDEATGEPVEGAWVNSSVEVKSKTGSTSVWSVAPPHLRTGKDGRFVIPAVSFGNGARFEVISFGVKATTADWRGGGLELKDRLGESEIEVTVLVRDAIESLNKKNINWKEKITTLTDADV